MASTNVTVAMHTASAPTSIRSLEEWWLDSTEQGVRRMLMDWFVSVREEESGAHLYRGGAAPDRATVLEQIVRAGREIAHREDGSVIALAGEVVIDGTPVDAIAFGDPGVNDETLRFEIGAAFDRVRSHTGVRPEMRRSSTGSVPGMRAQQG
ncbi:hypothetical protein [Rhodococcus erythropolis]|uniref:hypothetical protein n=1 Tax=Rhodococcus erythropolis TaxID=1833 RepID=UPI001EDE1887|nr:hypothetical protein [Rhodococcus erythropolis]UKO89766.1 hypothetical protein ITJ47_32275 [Rhodococcus erythropolis]